MKNSAIFTLMLGIIMACSFSAQADENKSEQRPKFNPEKMVQHQAEAMANKMQLDDAQTGKFIETYKEYLKEMHGVYKQNAPQKGFKRGGEQQVRKTDAEVEQEILNQFAMSRSIIDVREKYYKKFRTFLNPRQIKMIYANEREKASHMKFEKLNRGKHKEDRMPKEFNKDHKGKMHGGKPEMKGRKPEMKEGK